MDIQAEMAVLRRRITSEIATPEEKLLYTTLQILGEKGEHWIKGAGTDGMGNFCLGGALGQAQGRLQLSHEVVTNVQYKLSLNGGIGSIPHFNDSTATKFENIKEVILKSAADFREHSRSPVLV